MRRAAATRLVFWGFGGLCVALQLVPYGHRHSNPPVAAEPPWVSADTRALAKRACFDCHSNETRWPPYSYVAPISWLVQSDVDTARSHLNFSEWNRPQEHAEDAAELVRNREMPPAKYLALHPSARLTDAERDRLVRGFLTMVERVGQRFQR